MMYSATYVYISCQILCVMSKGLVPPRKWQRFKAETCSIEYNKCKTVQ